MASDAAKRQLARWTTLDMTEPVVYRPAGGEARTIAALVDRGGRDADGATRAAAPGMTAIVLNDAADGIAATEINTGGDRIDLAERVGGIAVRRQIRRIAEQDPDLVRIDVQ